MFSLDERIAQAQDDYGSKRFEGQRAKREVAELEHWSVARWYVKTIATRRGAKANRATRYG